MSPANVRVTLSEARLALYGEVGLMSSIEALLNFKPRIVGNVRVTTSQDRHPVGFLPSDGLSRPSASSPRVCCPPVSSSLRR